MADGKQMNFVIYAPGPYSPYGGGSIALHKLCHNIASLGEKAYIVTAEKNPNYLGEMVLDSKIAQAKELCKNGIAIYPEVIVGNPFEANHVMRWILYHNRTIGNHGVYGEKDLIYKYAPEFKLRYDRPINGYLRAFELNLDIFIDKGYNRKGTCHVYRKMHYDSIKRIHDNSSIKIDGYAELGGNNFLVEQFNNCEMFISYDQACYLNVMAALCGCISVVAPFGDTKAEDWYNSFPYFKYGIAYGLDQIEHAKSTLHLVRENLLELERESIELTKSFIETAYKTRP